MRISVLISSLLALFGALSFNDLKPDTPEQLGEQLFFDPILSLDSTEWYIRKYHIRVVLGDRVTVAVSPYDPTHGLVVYRAR